MCMFWSWYSLLIHLYNYTNKIEEMESGAFLSVSTVLHE